MEKKRALFDIKLNSIQDTDKPTKKEVEFILHDFEVSHNNSIISKETALKTLHTLKDMPIVCKYHPVSEVGADDDALGSHELYLDQDRKSGDTILGLDTVPIGVFTEDGYISTILDENGQEKEVVIGKGILWASRFPNVIGLLKEWNDSGIDVVSSMEILYDSYLFKDGVEEILSYVYEGHCILNSEERGDHQKVYPAYDVSKITKLVAQAVNQENIDKQLNDKEVNKVEEKETVQEIAETEEVETTQDQLVGDLTTEEVVKDEVDTMQKEMSALKEKVSKLESEKASLEEKFNEATDKLLSLNAELEQLRPYKEQFETKQNEEKLEKKKEFYSKKFEALKASEKFTSEEVQELLSKSIYENEDGKQAILQLNSMLVDLVELVTEDSSTIRELSSKREKLLPDSTDFESKYSN
ncbi:hypothetical protein P4571_07775 [Niallia alba]|uniref:hypothetical protein n=1 Tax=Niallia alba TaxID=2729105 RepID=UPI002E24B59A|nr:hypothetical protein [Niallia alba]